MPVSTTILSWRQLGSLLLVLAGTPAFAQTTLSGMVRNAAGQPLAGVVLEAETKAQPPVTAFVISGADGRYTLTLAAPAGTDSVYLQARALGYVDQRLRLANHSQTVLLLLQASPTKLREVIVRGAPITRQSDTLTYKVGSFAGKQDRVLADVLKKMPGIEVDGNGRISYEGRPINTFYINGQDLLQGRYTLASNNLPVEAVQNVQVLERHQPVRALGSLDRPANAALNITLARKVTTTGQAQVGAGGGPTPLGALWSANFSPMLFTNRQQLLDTYQTNNTGQDVATQLRPQTVADLQRGSEPAPSVPDFTHVVSLGRPPVGESRFLFNRVHLLSANHLIPLGPENQLRINASYLHDQHTARGYTRTQFLLPDNHTITLAEAKANREAVRHLLADVTFRKNEKHYYLQNSLGFDGRQHTQTGYLRRSESGEQLYQQARLPVASLTNQLTLVRPLGSGTRLLQVTSLTVVGSSPQRLAVSPGPFAPLLAGGLAYDSVRQQARLAGFFTANSAGLTFSRRVWAFTGQAGFVQETQHLMSALTTTAGSTPPGLALRNDLRWSRTRYFLVPGVQGTTHNWTLNLRVPLSYNRLRAIDAPLGAGQHVRAVAAEPSLSVTRPLGLFWRVWADAGLRTGFGDISQLSYAYLLRDYRTLQRTAAPLLRSQSLSYSGGFAFTDPVRSRFAQFSYTYSCILSNRLYSSQVESSGALTTVALNQTSRVTSHLLNATVSQFITPAKTNLSLQVLGSLTGQPQLLNGQLIETRTRSGTTSLKASVSAFTWGSLDYRASLTVLRSQVAGVLAPAPALVHQQQASASVFPMGGHQLSLTVDYYNSRGPAPSVRALFADLLYRYSLPTKGRKVDLELRWNNMLDGRQYQYSFITPFQLAQTTYQLRPAQVLASMRMSL